MFITPKKEENICKDEFESLYKSKFSSSIDIINCKRSIIIHNDFDYEKSLYEGICTTKCTIINLSVLDGKYQIDTHYNPEKVLVKTIYNGCLITSLNDIHNKKLKLNYDFLKNSKFRLINAHTSYIGIWSIYQFNDHFSPFGVSILDMIDLKNALINFRNHISIYDNNISVKIEISFDGDSYQTVLPLPLPQYYSRMHSELNKDNPIITNIVLIPFIDICDEHTKISGIKIKHKNIDTLLSNNNNNFYKSTAEFLTCDGNILVQNENTYPLHVKYGLLRGLLCDDLFVQLFKLYCRYQLSSLNFIADMSRDKFMISSMTFSYDNPPVNFSETLIHEMVCNDDILNSLKDIKIAYENIKIFGRITDLKYDITVLFENNDNPIKYIKYHNLVFDIFNSNCNTDTNILRPIISY